jgi:hypothetical protein
MPFGGALGQGGKERRGIGVVRIGKEASDLLFLDLLARVLHLHPLRGFCHHAHVVGDQDEPHLGLALDVGEEIEDLRLNGHIERGGGFVRDEKPGFAGQRHGDHHALRHAAGQLVGKGFEPAFRVGDADEVEKLDRPALPPGAVEVEVGLERLLDLEADREAGVERGHRFLEDHRHVAADDLAALFRGHAAQVAAVKAHLVRRDGCGPGQEAHGSKHGDGFAGAGFTHDGENVALIHGDVDAVHGAEGTACGVEFHGEVLDGEEGHRGPPFVSEGFAPAGAGAIRRGALPPGPRSIFGER